MAQAFTTLATQTEKEADAHSVIAGALLNDISIPLKSLVEAQVKERKSVNEKLMRFDWLNLAVCLRLKIHWIKNSKNGMHKKSVIIK